MIARGSEMRKHAQQLQQEARKKSLFGIPRGGKRKNKAQPSNEFVTVSQNDCYMLHDQCLECLSRRLEYN